MKTGILTLCIGLLIGIGPVLAQPGQATSRLAKPTRPVKKKANPSLAIKAHNYGDSIVLRWSVNQGAYWLAANERGYILERFTYLPGKKLPSQKRLNVAPIKPWSLDSMKKRLPRDDRYVAIAAQILHGKNPVPAAKGGSADFYRQYQQQQGQLLVAAMAAEFSPKAADALGMRWVDRSFNKLALRCVYRLRINNGPAPKLHDLTDTAWVSVVPYQIDSLTAPRTARVEAGDRTLRLIWYKQHSGGTFTGYYIERSDDGQRFVRLNQTPYVSAPADTAARRRNPQLNAQEVDFTDSIPANYRKFQYQIIGINSFGDLSPASALLVGSGRDLTPPRAPTDLQKKVEDNRRIILTWALANPSPDLKGFYVGQANDIAGPYQPLSKTLIPPATRVYVNEKPMPYLGKYYIVAAVDTAGNVNYSAPITALIDDKTPPSAPKKLIAKVDTNGIATIQWGPNTEPDLLGYKVYRSYQRDNEYYEQRTLDILADTMFVDTLITRTLTRKAFYKIVAVDFSNNLSLFSEPIAVAIPDKIPPATPIIQAATVENRGIRLSLIPSQSDDVVSHTLYRRESIGVWQEIAKISGHPTANIAYLDTALVHEQTYEYSLIARDKGGRLSEQSFVVSARYVNLAKYAVLVPAGLKAMYDPKQKHIRVEWVCKPPETMYHYLVYRGINGESVTAYKQVRGSTAFTDTNLPTEGIYEYAVRLILPEQQSKLSQSAKTTYRP